VSERSERNPRVWAYKNSKPAKRATDNHFLSPASGGSIISVVAIHALAPVATNMPPASQAG